MNYTQKENGRGATQPPQENPRFDSISDARRQQVLSTNGGHLTVPLFDGAKASAPQPELLDIRPLFTEPSKAADLARARDKLDGWAIMACNERPEQRKGFRPTRMALLISELDSGNLAAEQVTGLVKAFYGDTIAAIYSTASSRPEAKRWRIVVPLAQVVDVEVWLLMQRAFAEFMLMEGVTVDASMDRATQLSFAPNVPMDGRNPITGEPLMFVHMYFGVTLFDPTRLTAVAQTAVQIVRELDAAEAQAKVQQREESQSKAAEREAQRQKALADGGDGMSVIEKFNAAHHTEALMVSYGYTEDEQNPGHWRSPMQTSGTFATQLHPDGGWHSLSGSDAAAGLGRPSTKGGRFGSAFDLFVFFEHRGNFGRAVASQAPAPAPTLTAFSGLANPFGGGLVNVGVPSFDATGDGKGYTASRSNLERALLTDDLCQKIGFDQFKAEVMICDPGSTVWRPLKDTDLFQIGKCLEQFGFKRISKEMIRDAVKAAAEQNSFDSAQDWLNGLQWDGVPRVHEFLEKGFGAEPGGYHEAIGRYVFSGLAGRVLEPGCKCDMAPIVVGGQGVAKSTAIEAIAPNEDCFGELNLALNEPDLFRAMRGKVVMELPELSGLRKKDVEDIKRFMSSRVNRWTAKFEEAQTTYARRGLFFGSTNQTEFLSDTSGERRWLPFTATTDDSVEQIKARLNWIRSNRDQLWAEGAHLFRAHGVMFQDAQRLAKAVHGDYAVTDPWDEILREWAGRAWWDGVAPSANPITTLDALTKGLGLTVAQINRGAEMRAGASLQRLGFLRVQRRVDGSRRWLYVRPDLKTD